MKEKITNILFYILMLTISASGYVLQTENKIMTENFTYVSPERILNVSQDPNNIYVLGENSVTAINISGSKIYEIPGRFTEITISDRLYLKNVEEIKGYNKANGTLEITIKSLGTIVKPEITSTTTTINNYNNLTNGSGIFSNIYMNLSDSQIYSLSQNGTILFYDAQDPFLPAWEGFLTFTSKSYNNYINQIRMTPNASFFDFNYYTKVKINTTGIHLTGNASFYNSTGEVILQGLDTELKSSKTLNMAGNAITNATFQNVSLNQTLNYNINYTSNYSSWSNTSGNMTNISWNTWKTDNSTNWSNITLDNTTIEKCSGAIQLQDQVTNGLMGYWTADGCSQDQSGNGNTGTLTNGATYNVSGKYNQAFQLDGVNDFVQVTNVPTVNNITVLVFGKSKNSTWNNYGWLVSTRLNNGYLIHPWKDEKNWSGYIYDSGGTAYSIGKYAPTPNITEWHQYGIIYNNTEQKGYMIFDGNIVINTSLSITRTSSNLTINFGRDVAGEIRYGDGFLDEVRIYNRALSNDEINLTYNNSKERFGKVRVNASITSNESISNISITGLDANHLMNISSSSNNLTFTSDCLACSANTNYTVTSLGTNYQILEINLSSQNNQTSNLTNITIYYNTGGTGSSGSNISNIIEYRNWSTTYYNNGSTVKTISISGNISKVDANNPYTLRFLINNSVMWYDAGNRQTLSYWNILQIIPRGASYRLENTTTAGDLISKLYWKEGEFTIS